jgi:8-oxo-dGTP pyrophosphatase MutT (NUDIX family)
VRRRAGALVINDRRLLLLGERGEGFYWTPGGGLEDGEDLLAAIERELREELGTEPATAEPFLEVWDDIVDEQASYFLVTLSRPPAPPKNATRLVWYGRSDATRGSITVSKRVRVNVVPPLIAARLI